MSVGGAPRLKEGRSNCERAGSPSSRGAERPGEKGGKRGLKSTDARARMTQGEERTLQAERNTQTNISMRSSSTSKRILQDRLVRAKIGAGNRALERAGFALAKEHEEE